MPSNHERLVDAARNLLAAADALSSGHVVCRLLESPRGIAGGH